MEQLYTHRNVPALNFILTPLLIGCRACTCNLATLEAEFRNCVGSIPVGGNSPSMGEWIA